MANVPKQWIRKGDRNDFVTDYAMTSPEEDFAEPYAWYTLNTLKLWKVAIAQSSPALLEKPRIRSAKQKFGPSIRHAGKDEMKVTEGIRWILAPTARFQESLVFFRDVMGLPVVEEGVPVTDTQFSRYAQIKLPNGVVLV